MWESILTWEKSQTLAVMSIRVLNQQTQFTHKNKTKKNKQASKPQGPVTCRACMLLMFLDMDGGWNSPFLLLLASPSFLEFRSMARLNVYVLWGKGRGSE